MSQSTRANKRVSQSILDSIVSSPSSSFVEEKVEMQRYYDNFYEIETQALKMSFVTTEL
jgi:hypothetical protein